MLKLLLLVAALLVGVARAIYVRRRRRWIPGRHRYMRVVYSASGDRHLEFSDRMDFARVSWWRR